MVTCSNLSTKTADRVTMVGSFLIEDQTVAGTTTAPTECKLLTNRTSNSKLSNIYAMSQARKVRYKVLAIFSCSKPELADRTRSLMVLLKRDWLASCFLCSSELHSNNNCCGLSVNGGEQCLNTGCETFL